MIAGDEIYNAVLLEMYYQEYKRKTPAAKQLSVKDTLNERKRWFIKHILPQDEAINYLMSIIQGE